MTRFQKAKKDVKHQPVLTRSQRKAAEALKGLTQAELLAVEALLAIKRC